MELCEQLKEEYLRELGALMDEYNESSKRKIAEDSEDEAVFEAIKANICDIFHKVFIVSYNKACRDTGAADVKLAKLSEVYLDFFFKIPAPWKEKMVKDIEHGMMEECYKEQIKLEMADSIKGLFIKYYDRFYKEIK